MHHAYKYQMDDVFTLLSIILFLTFCAVIFMHRDITAFFGTSHTPLSVLGVQVPVQENRKL